MITIWDNCKFYSMFCKENRINLIEKICYKIIIILTLMGIIIIVRNNWLYGIIKYGILNHRKDHLLYFKMEDKTDINIGSL